MANGVKTSRLRGLLFALAILTTLPILWLIVCEIALRWKDGGSVRLQGAER